MPPAFVRNTAPRAEILLFFPKFVIGDIRSWGDSYRGWANSWVTLFRVTSGTKAWCASAPMQALPKEFLELWFRREVTGMMGLSSVKVHDRSESSSWEVLQELYHIRCFPEELTLQLLCHIQKGLLGVFWRQRKRKQVQINSETVLSLKTHEYIIISSLLDACMEVLIKLGFVIIIKFWSVDSNGTRHYSFI